MNLAITLLVTIAIASVVGTVLQQNQPYEDYIIKFGPFWFDVFNQLGLFDVYGASWFLLILAILVTSTSVCIYRNTPQMLREFRSYRESVQRKSLQAFHLRHDWQSGQKPEVVKEMLVSWLKANRYGFRQRQGEGFQVLAAMKGRGNKLGYFCTHAAIVIICFGALLDGNLPLTLREMAGNLKPETRNIPASQIPEISRLSVDNLSFRGSVSVPEGSSADLIFLKIRDGYVVQPLPFSVQVKDFRIEHYATGQPKSFESDLVLTDPDLSEPLETTISVNHPLVYKGYSIYQASFSDGGTGLSLSAWPLSSSSVKPESLNGVVFGEQTVDTAQGPMTIEFTDFRMFNINPVIDESGKKDQKNFGPNFTYKLRNAQGQALEFENYMLPVEFNKRQFLLSGVRESSAEPFRYLHIPIDSEGGIKRFQAFNARLFDDQRIQAAARRATERGFGTLENDKPGMKQEILGTMAALVAQFRTAGFDSVAQLVSERVPEEKRNDVLQAYFKVLQTILGELYMELLEDEGVELSQGLPAEEELYFDEVLTAISSLSVYAAPFYLQLDSFDFKQASGLQITRAPGKDIVYFGFGLLILGVFIMFYIPNRRIWFWIDDSADGCRILAAASGNRHERDIKSEFERMCKQIDSRIA